MNLLKVKRPVNIKYPINSTFGSTREIVINGKKEITPPHQGIDFLCPESTPIYAVASGKVLRADYQDERDHSVGLGLRVMQEFVFEDVKYIVCYGHMSEIIVDERDFVEEGNPIGLSGHTGHAEGPHLHVQFRKADSSAWINAVFV